MCHNWTSSGQRRCKGTDKSEQKQRGAGEQIEIEEETLVVESREETEQRVKAQCSGTRCQGMA